MKRGKKDGKIWRQWNTKKKLINHLPWLNMKKKTRIYGWTCVQNGAWIRNIFITFSPHFLHIHLSSPNNNGWHASILACNPIEMIFRNRFFFLHLSFFFILCRLDVSSHVLSSNWEKWLMNRKEINSICVNWWNVKFFSPTCVSRIRFISSERAVALMHCLFLCHCRNGILPHEAQFGLRLCMEMYAVKRAVVYLFCFARRRAVMNDERFLWWYIIFVALSAHVHLLQSKQISSI